MRLVIKKYAGAGWSAVETTNDGSLVVGELGGRREIGQRISAYLEGTCDDTEEGVDRLLAAVSWLRDELGKRQQRIADTNVRKKTKKVPDVT